MAAAAAVTGTPKVLHQEELQTFAAGAPAQGPYQAGLQTPDLMSYIDVTVFANQQRQQQQPVISPHLLAATALADGSKRTRESNPFQTSFENLAADAQTSSFLKIADAAPRVKAEVKKGKMKGKAAGAPRSVPPGAPGPPATGPPSNLGKAKRKGRQAETMEDGARTESKRDRNRLAAKNCRQRKIDKENNLRAQLKGLETAHVQLLARFNKLTSEVSALQST